MEHLEKGASNVEMGEAPGKGRNKTGRELRGHLERKIDGDKRGNW